MNRNQEAVRAIVREIVAVAFKSLVLALPHAKSVVGLRQPVFQIVHNNFVGGIVTLHSLQDNLALSIIHLGVSFAGLRVYLPQESLRIYVGMLPFDGRIELAEDVVEGGPLRGGYSGIIMDNHPRILSGTPAAAEVVRHPNLGTVQLGVFVIAFIRAKNEVRPAILAIVMVRRTRIEIAGAEHVATARFDVRSSDVEIRFGRSRLFLRA